MEEVTTLLENYKVLVTNKFAEHPEREKLLDRIYPGFEALLFLILANQWRGACHDTSAALYIYLTEVGVDAQLCIGETKAHKVFDHSWVEVGGLIFDAAVCLPSEGGEKVGGAIFAGINLDSGDQTSLKHGIYDIGLGEPAKSVSKWDLNQYVKESKSNIWDITKMIGDDVGHDLIPSNLAQKYGTVLRELIIMNTFYDWLMKQKGRECPVGDLATDVAGDRNFPKNASTLSVVLLHIRSRTSNQNAIEAAVEGWLEYLGSSNRGFDILTAIKDGIRFGYQCGFEAAADDKDSDGYAVAEDRYTEIFL